MVFTSVCASGSSFNSMISSFTMPVLGYGAVAGGMIIAVLYVISNSINNPKLNLWAKTEFFQLFFSIIATLLALQAINLFCGLDLLPFLRMFPISLDPAKTAELGSAPLNMFDGAELYLQAVAKYNKDLVSSLRYHLGAYNMLESRYLARCSESGAGVNILACLFGGLVGGFGGTNYYQSPEGGYALASPALFLSFNTAIFSYLSSLNYLFILKYVFSGFPLFFLPLGIFLRSVPFMRGLGSLMVSFSISFIFVYPLALSIFYTDFLTLDHILSPDIPQDYVDADIGEKLSTTDYLDADIRDELFDAGSQETVLMGRTGNGFILAVFIPTIAMLTSIGSVIYLARFIGEEIDLSRIVQMV